MTSILDNLTCEDCPQRGVHCPIANPYKEGADIMIVSDLPKIWDEMEDKVFTGKARNLMERELADMDINPDRIYWTYMCKCRQPGDEASKLVLKACRANLAREIKTMKPKMILLLGNTPLQGLIGKSGVTKYRGRVWKVRSEEQETKIICTVSPASVYRNPRFAEVLHADLVYMKNVLEGTELVSEDDLDYTVVQTNEQLIEAYNYLKKFDHFAYDLETEGLDYLNPDKVILTISLTAPDLKTFLIPVQHSDSPWRENHRKIFDVIRPLFESPEYKTIGHNVKFDNKWLQSHYNIVTQNTADTMLMCYILDENSPNGLKHIAQLYFGARAYDDGIKFTRDYDLAKLAKYNSLDTFYTMQAYHLFKEELKKDPQTARIYSRLLVKGSEAFTQIETVGLYIDRKLLAERTKIAEENQRRTYQELVLLLPPEYAKVHLVNSKGKVIPFNPNSTKQVAGLLYSEPPVGLGLPILDYTEKGAPSTAEGTLIRLQDHTKSDVMEKLMEYRKWSKYLSTYLIPWEEKSRRDSRLHATYKLHGTVTGRLSAEDGVHQIPRDNFIRGIISAPPGWYFVEADYSQMELRVAAMEANEPTMIETFINHIDIHTKTAAETTGKDPSEVTKDERKKAKATNFGFLYGMGWKKFVGYAKEKYQVELTDTQAKQFRQRFFDTYKALPEWHQRQRDKVKKYGYVRSLIGRKRNLPDIFSGDEGVRAEAERESINSPVQSLGSDVNLAALIDIYFSWVKDNTDKIVLTGMVHDAQMFEVREDYLNEALPRIKAMMEDPKRLKDWFGLDFTVPIEVEVEYGSHWDNCKVWEAPNENL